MRFAQNPMWLQDFQAFLKIRIALANEYKAGVLGDPGGQVEDAVHIGHLTLGPQMLTQ